MSPGIECVCVCVFVEEAGGGAAIITCPMLICACSTPSAPGDAVEEPGSQLLQQDPNALWRLTCTRHFYLSCLIVLKLQVAWGLDSVPCNIKLSSLGPRGCSGCHAPSRGKG